MDFVSALLGLADPLNWLYYGPPAVIVFAASSYLAGYLKMKKGIRTNYTRKVFHVMNFTYAAVIYLLGGTVAVVLYGGLGMGAMCVALALPEGHLLLEGIAREQDAPHRKLYVVIPFIATAVAGIIDNTFLPRFAVVGYLVSGWGDAAGEPVGVRWGVHRYRVRSLLKVECTRSVEGSVGVFVVSCVGAFAGLQIAGVDALLSVPIAFAAAGAATLVEAVSSHGLDNLTVQITACAVSYAACFAMGLV